MTKKIAYTVSETFSTIINEMDASLDKLMVQIVESEGKHCQSMFVELYNSTIEKRNKLMKKAAKKFANGGK